LQELIERHTQEALSPEEVQDLGDVVSVEKAGVVCWVSRISGAYKLTRINNSMSIPTTLPDFKNAVQIALDHVGKNGVLQLATDEKVDVLFVSAVKNHLVSGDGTTAPPQPFTSDYYVGFGRRYKGVPIVGSQLVIRLDGNGNVAMIKKIWRPIISETGKQAHITDKSIEDLVDQHPQVSDEGVLSGDIRITGIRAGYMEAPVSYKQEYLRPGCIASYTIGDSGEMLHPQLVMSLEDGGTVETMWGISSWEAHPVGVFENNKDIGRPTHVGSTVYEGYVWKEDSILTEQYLISGGGADIWDSSDQFQFAYKTLSGDVRLSASFEWVARENTWSKYGVMIRASDAPDSVHYFTCSRKDEDIACAQGRAITGAGSWNVQVDRPTGAEKPYRLAIQRVTVRGLPWVQSMVDWGLGAGWEVINTALDFHLPDMVLVGVALTSHDDNYLCQARAYHVNYELNPSMIGAFEFPVVPGEAAMPTSTSSLPGFKIHSLKPLVTDGWGYDAMNAILDTGIWMGLPAQPGSEGNRISEFVNLRDTGNGAFSAANGYPDETYPGIDPYACPAADPAGGDDDNNHATEITACIQLTAGLHIIGVNSDDGTIIEIGGVEVGRTREWKSASNVDFVYEVAADGYYDLRVRHMEGGGGSSIELHEILMDGTRILLNNVAQGGSPVFAPSE
jgi:hypothetical protein